MIYTLYTSGQNREMWFLTEDENEKGIYNVYILGGEDCSHGGIMQFRKK